MIDKLKKIAELQPELFNLKFEAPYPDCEEEVILLDYPVDDAKLSENEGLDWILIGRLVDDLQSLYPDTNILISPANADQLAFIEIDDEIALDAPTLLEAVCDAWLSLKGGE